MWVDNFYLECYSYLAYFVVIMSYVIYCKESFKIIGEIEPTFSPSDIQRVIDLRL